MKINSEKMKGQWCDFKVKEETISIFIKPFSAFVLNLSPGESTNLISYDNVQRIVQYCIEDWKGIQNEHGKKLPCTKENKMIICETFPELFSFVMEKSQLIREEIVIPEEELKNSLQSPDGGAIQSDKPSAVMTAEKQSDSSMKKIQTESENLLIVT